MIIIMMPLQRISHCIAIFISRSTFKYRTYDRSPTCHVFPVYPILFILSCLFICQLFFIFFEYFCLLYCSLLSRELFLVLF